MSDFQQIQQILEDLLIEEETTCDNEHKLGPGEIHEFLARMMCRSCPEHDHQRYAFLVIICSRLLILLISLLVIPSIEG